MVNSIALAERHAILPSETTMHNLCISSPVLCIVWNYSLGISQCIRLGVAAETS